MNDGLIFLIGGFAFGMTLVGIVLTIAEFRRMASTPRISRPKQ